MEKKETKSELTYQNLDVWKQARILSNSIYTLTKNFPKEEIYSLTSQIRRAVVGVVCNIAEGCGQNTPKNTLRFLSIAKGSLYEVESQLFIAFDQNYITQLQLDDVLSQVTTCKKLLNGFLKYFSKLENG